MSAYREAVIADAPVGYWPLDEASGPQALDGSGHGYHATYVGAVQHAQPGPSASTPAITIAGAGYAEIAPAAPLPALTGAFSAEAWIRSTDPTNYPVICGRGNYNANGNGWELFGTTPTGIRAYGQVGASSVFDLSTHTVGTGYPVYSDGQWHHVALTWNGGTAVGSVRIYVNGLLIVQAGATVGALGIPTALPFRIGIESDGTTYGWKGSLAAVAIYDHALTPARIMAHVEAMRGIAPSRYREAVLADVPLAYFRVNETAGTFAADSSAHARSGLYVGGPYLTLAQPGMSADSDAAIKVEPPTNLFETGIRLTGFAVTPTLTIEAIVKPTYVASLSYARIFCSGSAVSFPVEFGMNSGGQLAYFLNFVTATPGWVLCPIWVGVGERAHVALSWDGTWVRVYKNGVQMHASNSNAGRTLINVGSTAGQRNFFSAYNGDALHAFCDEAAYYDRALSATRIAEHAKASKPPLGKALMYALGKVARGGATRGGYIAANTFMTIGGSQVGTTPVGGQRVLMTSLQITDTLEQAANTCSFTAHGFTPTVGQEVIVQLGSKNSLTRLFAGQILALEEVALADNPQQADNIAWAVSAIDYTWLLNRRFVIAQYRNQSATDIAIDLIARFTDDFTTRHVVADLPELDEITFTNASATDALSQLVKRIGGYFYIDYHRDLHLYVDQESANTATPPVPLTPAHVSLRHFTARRDLSQFITRVLSEGGGSNALALVVPGETLLPVEDAIWYAPTGGVVTVGPQRIRYASIRAGGGGALVGPGAKPSGAPNVVAVGGVGLAAGVYQYAITFGTASGESMPGPSALVVVSAIGLAAPQSAPPVRLDVGPGPEPGDYTYAVTFATAGGETTLSNFSSSVRTFDSPPRTADYPPVLSDSGYTRNPGMSPGEYQYRFGWIDYDYKYTEPGPAVAYTVGANYPQINGGLSGPQVPGMLGYTVFRNMPGGSTFKLLWYSQNSPVLDTMSDAQWNALPLWTGATSQQREVVIAPLPVSPSAEVIARNIYRWRSGGDGLFHKVGTVPGNTELDDSGQYLVFRDNVPNAGVGPAAPSVGTAFTQQVAVSGITVGPASVLRRYVYRTAANGAQLKRLATINDNTTTTLPNDTAADAALGGDVPTADASGLNLIGGQVNAGADTLLTSSGGWADVGGGWAIIGNGQAIRYRGVNGNTLIGIPVIGPGAITATVNYGSSIMAAPTLAGVPSAGDGAIVVAIKQGDAVNLLVQVDDLDAQRQLAVYVGGDGVQESYLSDNRLSDTEARARGQALIALRNQVEESIGYTTRDKNTRSGATARVALPLPTNVNGEYKIQQVTIALFQFPHVFPTFAVQASSNRFSFEDLLRLAQRAGALNP